MAGTVAAYLSVGTEPIPGVVFALWKRGTYVLLPVLLPDGDLDWASYEGPDSLTPGPRGLLEPAEPPPGCDGNHKRRPVIVPALAVGPGRAPAGPRRRQLRPGPGQGRAAIQTVALLYRRRTAGRGPGGRSRSAGPHRARRGRRNQQAPLAVATI